MVSSILLSTLATSAIAFDGRVPYTMAHLNQAVFGGVADSDSSDQWHLGGTGECGGLTQADCEASPYCGVVYFNNIARCIDRGNRPTTAHPTGLCPSAHDLCTYNSRVACDPSYCDCYPPCPVPTCPTWSQVCVEDYPCDSRHCYCPSCGLIPPTPTGCERYTNQNSCITGSGEHGFPCTWKHNSCTQLQNVNCDQVTDESTCNAVQGCAWHESHGQYRCMHLAY